MEGFTVVSRFLPGNNYDRDASSLLEAAGVFKLIPVPRQPYQTIAVALIYTRQCLAGRN